MTLGRKIFLIYLLLFAAATALLISYYAPTSKVVVITAAESKLSDKDGIITARNPQDGAVRDVYYISTRDQNEKPMMYRNEDAPWYFKFNSNTIQAQAQSIMELSKQTQHYGILVSYGWHSDYFSIFKNVVSLKPTADANSSTFSFYTIITIIEWLLWLSVLIFQLVFFIKITNWREKRAYQS